MSGRKSVYVDEVEWNRLRREAGKLAEMKRDLPRLVDQVQQATEREIGRSMEEVRGRHAELDQAISGLSERNRQFEQQTARRLRSTADRLQAEMTEHTRKVRAETRSELDAQREQLRRAMEEERRDRDRRLTEINSRIDDLRGDHDRAAALTSTYLADAEVLRGQVLKFPHERYLPGRFDALDRRFATAKSNVDDGVAAFGLSGAQELCQSFGELRLELEVLDQEWRVCRAAAERELVVLQELIAQNTTLDIRLGDGATDAAPNVDHWSRGALSRLGEEVAAQLAQVRDESQPLSTDSLARIASTVAPEFEQRLESVVGQAVTAMHAAQLRANLTELIVDALDQHHHYEVTAAGFAGDDQREAFLAKTVHHASSSEIVVEVRSEDQDRPPVVRLHNFDADGASEAERAARTRSIRDSVRVSSGLELTAQEDAPAPDEDVRDVGRLVTRTETRLAGPTTGPA